MKQTVLFTQRIPQWAFTVNLSPACALVVIWVVISNIWPRMNNNQVLLVRFIYFLKLHSFHCLRRSSLVEGPSTCIVPVESRLSGICEAPVTVCDYQRRRWQSLSEEIRCGFFFFFLKAFLFFKKNSSITVTALAASVKHKHSSGL